MDKNKKLFIIRPVRGISDEYREAVETQIEHLRKTFDVYDPLTNTDQNDNTGLRICRDNRDAIKKADIVAVIWDGKSTGCLFDLGMAFALKKKIMPITGYFPSLVGYDGKSFVNMVWAWEENGAVEPVQPTEDGKPLVCPNCGCKEGFICSACDTGEGWACDAECPICNRTFEWIDYPFGDSSAGVSDFESIGWRVI